jgi:tetratricopeptide (TPR) repeat protein
LGQSAKEWDEAITLYRRAIELKPDFSWFHYYSGDSLCKKGLIDEASACYRRAIELQPKIA